jgi:hypothetical protein
MVTITDTVGKLELSHRYMLEQRWVGRFSDATLSTVDEFVFQNRLRYLIRLQYAFNKPRVQPGAFYGAAYNEILIGFGADVNNNVFDQNRVGGLVGYQFSKLLRLEAGVFQQIIQLGRRVNDRNVFQYNSGAIVNVAVGI